MRSPVLWIVIALGVSGCDSQRSGVTERIPPRALEEPTDAKSIAERDAIRLDEIKRIVAEQYDVNLARLDVDKPLLDYGDELNVIEVVMDLEEKYRIEIPDERIRDKKAKGVGIHRSLTTRKLAEIVKDIKGK